MDIIVDKLNLIDDVKGVILEFCYDKRGYTYKQLQKMENIRQNEIEPYLLRIKYELKSWKNLNVRVYWLKSCRGNIGCYSSLEDEDKNLFDAVVRRELSWDNWERMQKTFHRVVAHSVHIQNVIWMMKRRMVEEGMISNEYN